VGFSRRRFATWTAVATALCTGITASAFRLATCCATCVSTCSSSTFARYPGAVCVYDVTMAQFSCLIAGCKCSAAEMCRHMCLYYGRLRLYSWAHSGTHVALHVASVNSSIEQRGDHMLGHTWRHMCLYMLR